MTTAAEQLVTRLNLPFCTGLSDCKTVKEAIQKAGLDYEISLHPVITDTVLPTNYMATVREDKQKVLGIVGKKYNVLQNRDAFNFFEEFVSNDLVSLETAGQLYDGKKIFVLAKINDEDMEITPGDRVEKYILLSNSNDGTSSVRVGFVPIRVVCCNMLQFVHSHEASKLIKVNHKRVVADTLTEIRATMDLVNKQFIATEEQYKKLAQNTNICKKDIEKYVKQVFNEKSLNQIIFDYENQIEEKEQIEETRKRLIARVEEIFDLEPVHSAWTLYNSVNYYINHERSKSVDMRYNSLFFEDGKKFNEKAFELAKRL